MAAKKGIVAVKHTPPWYHGKAAVNVRYGAGWSALARHVPSWSPELFCKKLLN
jgi:hypothetical protein